MTTGTKPARYDLTINIPATMDIKYVDVWPDNGYGAQVSVKGTIDGQTQTIYLKGKAWANLKALQNGGVIGDYDQSVEEPAAKVNVPVVNGTGAVLTMRKLPSEKYANLVVSREGAATATYGNGAPAPYQSPSRNSPNARPDFLREQEQHETQTVASIQQGAVDRWAVLFAAYDKCMEFVLKVEAPKLKAAGVEVTHEGLSAQTATLLIAAKDKGLAA